MSWSLNLKHWKYEIVLWKTKKTHLIVLGHIKSHAFKYATLQEGFNFMSEEMCGKEKSKGYYPCRD